MYLRISKGRQKSYLVLVQGYRDNGKVKQRTVCNLGPIDANTAKQSLALGKKLLQQFGASAIIDGSEIAEKHRNNWGAYEVLQHLWKAYNLDQFWQQQLQKRKIQYDLPDLIQLMIAGRICNPCSKLSLFENQKFYDGFVPVELQTLYKALDELDYHKDELSRHLFARQQELHGEVTIAFFDVTTMYFESVKPDDIKAFGFSKDCKFGEVQIVLSLLSDSKGNPLAYELFPGNVSEGKTFINCLKDLKEKYNIKKAVIVADRGMYCAENLQYAVDMGFSYIVGTKLRNSTAKIKEQTMQIDDYQNLGNEEEYKYKVINKERVCHKETIIASWSKKRANKDARDRARLVDKAMKLLRSGKVNDHKGGKKYLKVSKARMELDSKKIEQDARWDGFYGVSTNSNLAPYLVLEAYHNLWRIEESFRIMKNYFETRPMFHWTPKRISGHIMLNFMAMIFERYIENKLRNGGKNLSANKIRNGISGLQKSILSIDNKQFISYANLTDHSLDILQILGINIPKSHMLK